MFDVFPFSKVDDFFQSRTVYENSRRDEELRNSSAEKNEEGDKGEARYQYIGQYNHAGFNLLVFRAPVANLKRINHFFVLVVNIQFFTDLGSWLIFFLQFCICTLLALLVP